jgi:protein-S-isoprenylcysteine O-methyltransferase Ste14
VPTSGHQGAIRSRGGGWVVAQFAVMAATALLWLVPPHVDSPILRVIGIVLAGAGVLLFVSAYRALGRSFTAFPQPLSTGELVEAGPFRLVRHPTYGGGVLLFAGLSLALGLTGLAGTAVLAVLWWRKSLVEERNLAEHFPDYAAYRSRVPHRYLPWLL